jgi:hypothetical protein
MLSIVNVLLHDVGEKLIIQYDAMTSNAVQHVVLLKRQKFLS